MDHEAHALKTVSKAETFGMILLLPLILLWAIVGMLIILIRGLWRWAKWKISTPASEAEEQEDPEPRRQ